VCFAGGGRNPKRPASPRRQCERASERASNSRHPSLNEYTLQTHGVSDGEGCRDNTQMYRYILCLYGDTVHLLYTGSSVSPVLAIACPRACIWTPLPVRYLIHIQCASYREERHLLGSMGTAALSMSMRMSLEVIRTLFSVCQTHTGLSTVTSHTECMGPHSGSPAHPIAVRHVSTRSRQPSHQYTYSRATPYLTAAIGRTFHPVRHAMQLYGAAAIGGRLTLNRG
jgi:hypothetical protein